MLSHVDGATVPAGEVKEVSEVIIDDEYMARLRAMVEGLPEVDLDRLGRCDGPRILVQLDDGGLPISGVIYVPDSNRLVKVQLPVTREAAPLFALGSGRPRVERLGAERLA